MCPGCVVGVTLWSGFWLTDRIASWWVSRKRHRAMLAAVEPQVGEAEERAAVGHPYQARAQQGSLQ